MPSISGVRCPILRTLASLRAASFIALLLRGGAHRLDNLHVARAAAEVARERRAHVVFGRMRIAPQQSFGGHDHPRRAETALRAEVLVERLLQSIDATADRETLDRLHALAFAGR